MAVYFQAFLVRIERSYRKQIFLLSSLLKQQRDQEQLQVLLEILIFLKAQPIHQVQEEEWLDNMEVMRLYRISRSTLYRWKIKKLLIPRRVGNRDIYLRRDLEHFFSLPTPSGTLIFMFFGGLFTF
jgi:hypothetical protein